MSNQGATPKTPWSSPTSTHVLGIGRLRGTVRHKDSEYVQRFFDQLAHANDIDSLYSTLKMEYVGILHIMSGKHLHGYVQDFGARNNIREADATDQMAFIVVESEGKTVPYSELTNPKRICQSELL